MEAALCRRRMTSRSRWIARFAFIVFGSSLAPGSGQMPSRGWEIHSEVQTFLCSCNIRTGHSILRLGMNGLRKAKWHISGEINDCQLFNHSWAAQCHESSL